MDDLDKLLQELSSVIMTETTKGGITEPQIMKEYLKLCGKRVEFAKFKYRSLGELLRDNPQRFSCQVTNQGVKWFGKVNEGNEDIIRSMASEKSKKGARGMPPRRPFAPSFGVRDSTGPSFGRATPTPFGANHARFHQSSSDGVLQGSYNMQGSSSRSRNETDSMGYKEIPAKTGFGNKAFNYAPRDSASKSSSRTASADNSGDEDERFAAAAAEGGRPSSATSGRYKAPGDSFREMVGKNASTPEYPPGLQVGGANDENTEPSKATWEVPWEDEAAMTLNPSEKAVNNKSKKPQEKEMPCYASLIEESEEWRCTR